MRYPYASLLFYIFAAFFFLTAGHCAERRSSRFSFEGRQIAIDTYQPGAKDGIVQGTLILLHGSSGPDLPIYRQQAEYFADHGFTVAVPHFFDATKSTEASPQNYTAWARLIAAFTASVAAGPAFAGNNTFLVGYSLGVEAQ